MLPKPLLSAFAALLLATVTAYGTAYVVWILPTQETTKAAKQVRDFLTQESNTIKSSTNEKKKNRGNDQSRIITSAPQFLDHINKTAQETNTIIRELTPNSQFNWQYNLKINANYPSFLDFITQIECLSIIINDLAIHPFDYTAEQPVHAISFSITPLNNAAPISDADCADLEGKARAWTRNPFQRFAPCFDGESTFPCQVTEEIDLTWLHRLSGIGEDANGLYATIDRRDYRIDDQFGDMRVVEIGPEYVRLVEIADGTPEEDLKRYILSFQQLGLTPTGGARR